MRLQLSFTIRAFLRNVVVLSRRLLKLGLLQLRLLLLSLVVRQSTTCAASPIESSSGISSLVSQSLEPITYEV
ncbi:hypothetical protein ACFX1S_014010 [Malus domestica]